MGTDPGGGGGAGYWKNGNPVTITDIKGTVSVSGIAVLGDDVYISGTEVRDSRDFAVYWRNGKRVELNDNVHDVATNGIVNKNSRAFRPLEASRPKKRDL